MTGVLTSAPATATAAAVWVDTDKPYRTSSGSAHVVGILYGKNVMAMDIIFITEAACCRRQQYMPDLGACLIRHVAKEEASFIVHPA